MTYLNCYLSSVKWLSDIHSFISHFWNSSDIWYLFMISPHWQGLILKDFDLTVQCLTTEPIIRKMKIKIFFSYWSLAITQSIIWVWRKKNVQSICLSNVFEINWIWVIQFVISHWISNPTFWFKNKNNKKLGSVWFQLSRKFNGTFFWINPINAWTNVVIVLSIFVSWMGWNPLLIVILEQGWNLDIRFLSHILVVWSQTGWFPSSSYMVNLSGYVFIGPHVVRIWDE